MEDQEFERIFIAASEGKTIHLNPVDRSGLIEWAKRKGKLVEDKLTQLQELYSQKTGENSLPTPKSDIGYPVKGFYEEIYFCLLTGNELSAAILAAITVEYVLKASIYSLSKSRFEFSRTEWGDQKLDEKTFGKLLSLVKGKFSDDLYNRLNVFKTTRNNLAHANIVKTQSGKSIRATVIETGRPAENIVISTAELPSIAWESFITETRKIALEIFREANFLIGQMWEEVRGKFS